jgi:dienelactone hydrolase
VSEVAVVDDETIMVLGGGPANPTAIYLLKVDTSKLPAVSSASAGASIEATVPTVVTMLASSFSSSIEPFNGYLSQPVQLEYPTADHSGTGEEWTAFANYYPPTNRDYDGSEAASAGAGAAGAVEAVEAADAASAATAGSGDLGGGEGDRPVDDGLVDDGLPPVLVKIHGGPTSRAPTTFRLDIQFWTSRGFAVLDVNYGGSTGFGRAYRKRLAKNWGVVDVDDCCAAVEHLVSKGLASPHKCCIDGGSAGGFTTLACLVRPKTPFSVGCSKYGVSDLKALAAETHKFESRYLDGLVGPYPEEAALYEERSPVNHADSLACPLLLLQGDEDEIVPPNQSELMFEAAKAKGIPTCYVVYKGRCSTSMHHAPYAIQASS